MCFKNTKEQIPFHYFQNYDEQSQSHAWKFNVPMLEHYYKCQFEEK